MEKHNEYRDNLARDIKETPKGEERKAKLAEAQNTEEYQTAEQWHRLAFSKKDLIQEMMESGEVDSPEQAVELVIERETQIEEWIGHDFDPETMPEFLSKYGTGGGYHQGEFKKRTNEVLEAEFEEYVRSNKDIQDFINLLREQGHPIRETYKRPKEFAGHISESEDEMVDVWRFQYDEALFSKLHEIFERIGQDDSSRALTGLLVAIRKEFPEMSSFNLASSLEANLRTSRGLDNGYKGIGDLEAFNMIMGNYNYKEGKEREMKGDLFTLRAERYVINSMYKNALHAWLPYSGVLRDAGRQVYTGSRSPEEDFDGNLIHTVRGIQYMNKLYRNFDKSFYAIEKVDEVRSKERAAIKFLGKDYSKVSKEMPEVIEILKTKDTASADIDVNNKLLAYIDGRSEYGSGGGIARFSKVELWHDGKIYSKEFQYRDRWNSSADRYENNFRTAKIKSVEADAEDNLRVTITASAGDNYSPRDVEFIVKKAEPRLNIPELKTEEQEAFQNRFDAVVQEKLSQKMEAWKGHTSEYYDKGSFNNDPTMGYKRYPQPTITTRLMDQKHGIGAFVVKEIIDHRVDDLQARCELYSVTGDGGPVLLAEDHGYQLSEGDPSIFGLEIKNGTLSYTTRNGRRTRDLLKAE
jgi:hypothetical protein